MDEPVVTFEQEWGAYRHWVVDVEPPLATVRLSVDPDGGLGSRYSLKLNSYDLAVDIELADIVQRLRFEHPEVHAVVLTGGLDKVFCAGANIQMLAEASHHHKVNFCKFTNETRLAIEDAAAHSGQAWLAAVNGTAAGGGYELALACDEIVLIDDKASSVSLPEVPMLGVLPGTGGLTRVVDKRHVRRDLADVFATRSEGIKGEQAREWGLVDVVAPRSRFEEVVRDRALALAARSDRPASASAPPLPKLEWESDAGGLRYQQLEVAFDRPVSAAVFTVRPAGDMLGLALELDHAACHLRFNAPDLGTWVLRSEGDPGAVLAADAALAAGDWHTREVRMLWKRTLQRLDLSSRTLIALVEPGSCFVGTLAELVLAADQSFMLDAGTAPDPVVVVTGANMAWYPMLNALSRLATRAWPRPVDVPLDTPLRAAAAAAHGLVTFTPDDLDWDDEVRIVLEERASFSPDALTGMEASLRFPGPETMATKIFGRLSAWQNWIFQRPNATGPSGGLRRYGTGSRPDYDTTRV